MRGSSAAGKRGLRATSAISATAEGPDSLNTSDPMTVWFIPTLTLNAPPISADWRAMSSAEREAVPCCIISPVTSPSQTSLAASSTLPVWVTSLTVTFGTSPYDTSLTFRPFGRSNFRTTGSAKFFGGAGGGGVSFAGGAVCASAAAAPRSVAARVRMIGVRRITCLLESVQLRRPLE